MKTIFFTIALVMASVCIRAQILLEALPGNKQTQYINYVDKDLDSLGKWNFFNLNRFTVNYNNKTLNTISIEGQLTYQFTSWLGLSAGGGFYGMVFIPTFGLSLSYINKKENFFIQMYPTIGIAEKQVIPSALGLIGYMPKFSKSWGLTSQVIFSVDPLEASQLIRIGANYKEKFQFGLGIDMVQNFKTKNLNFNIGPFIRITF